MLFFFLRKMREREKEHKSGNNAYNEDYFDIFMLIYNVQSIRYISDA